MSKNLNKSKTPFTIVTILVSLMMAGSLMLVGCQSIEGGDEKTSAFDTYIDSINTTSQESNGATVINYQVVVKADVNWTSMSDEKRKEITDAGIIESRKKASDDNVNNYNVMGVSNGKQIFFYNRLNEQVILYVDGVPTGTTVPAPAQ
jgi:hypothetical protein